MRRNDITDKSYNRAPVSPAKNKKIFNRVAGRYDLMNRIISLGMDGYWRRKAVDLLGPITGGTYLDAGCGTGDLIKEIAARFPTGCPKIIGIDQSEEMLSIGKEKISRLPQKGSVKFLKGDAVRLNLPDRSVNGIISAFVFRNLGDRRAALLEWLRVLKTGGKCVILELSRPGNPLVFAGYFIFTRLFVPLVSALFSRSKDYRYLVDSIHSFPPPDVVMDMMKKTGFARVSTFPLSWGVVRIFKGEKK